MKKTVFLTLIFCFVALYMMGQNSGTYTAKKTKVKTVTTNHYLPKFEKGWYIRPEVGINFPLQFEFLCGVGYQINPYLYLGLGTGVASFRGSYHGYTPNIWYSTTFPLFTTFKLNFLTTKNGFTPFFETKMGYALGIRGSSYYYSKWGDDFVEKYEPSGYYGHWGIGGSYKNFSLLISYHLLQYIKEEQRWNDYGYFLEEIYSKNADYFSLSIAYTIPLKKKQ